jgi:hypothetical protein
MGDADRTHGIVLLSYSRPQSSRTIRERRATLPHRNSFAGKSAASAHIPNSKSRSAASSSRRWSNPCEMDSRSSFPSGFGISGNG